MEHIREKEEYLERLWYMKEEDKDSIEFLQELMGDDFNAKILDNLAEEQLIELHKGKNKVQLTDTGKASSRRLIRAHRIAERMLYDVMGGDFESGACEFEHTVTPELVDSICTLLGHPRECPHGLSIPKGECCRSLRRVAESSIVPLTNLKVGQKARVAYVTSKNDQQLHKIDGLQIRPGNTVKLHQVYPTYVIECEGMNIALDEKITSNICIWKEPQHVLHGKKSKGDKDKKHHKKGFGFKFMKSEK